MTGWRKRQIVELTAREKGDILLAALFPNQSKLQETWWMSPNLAFDKSTPLEILDKDPDRVLQYLYCQFSGDYS